MTAVPKKENLIIPSRNVKAGIIGLVNSGKSAVFNMLSGGNAIVQSSAFTTIDPNYSTCTFFDEQLTALSKVYKPNKITYSFVSLLDSCGLVRDAHLDEGYGNDFLSLHQPMDILLHVVRAFDDEDVTHSEESVDPIRDIKIVNDELIEKDIELCQFIISTQEYAYMQGKLGAEGKHEYTTLIKIYETLSGKLYVKKGKSSDSTSGSTTSKSKGPIPQPRRLEPGRPLRMAKWDKHEIPILQKHNFLTAKEQVYIINLSMRDYLRENDKYTTLLMTDSNEDKDSGKSIGERLQDIIDCYGGGGFIKLSVGFEQYYQKRRQEDSAEDFEAYLQANPKHRSAVGPIFFQLYRQLDLIRFYTIDKCYTKEEEDEVVREVKIWFCEQGSFAPEAAGRILTDMERGFLCADVMTLYDLIELGSEAKVRRMGKMRQQGKRYQMNDCDVVYFQYNKHQVA